jgi:hypothetical protein
VSNFVTPSWFDPLAGATAQFDKLGQLHAPFTIVKGGYVVRIRRPTAAEIRRPVPQWRKDMKAGPLARTRRRLGQAASL